jgi:hypothetical protein
MGSKLFLMIFLIAISTSILAQDSYIKGRINSKLSYSKYPFLGYIPSKNDFTSCLGYEMNYGINNTVELGGYFGLAKYETFEGPLVTGQTYTNKNRAILMYGVNANIQLLPFFIRQNNCRFDLYASTKLGGIHHWKKSNDVFPETNKELFDYGLYGGLAFYPGKHWGVYCEYGYGNNTTLRYGLSLKF